MGLCWGVQALECGLCSWDAHTQLQYVGSSFLVGTEPGPLHWDQGVFNHWTIRQIPLLIFKQKPKKKTSDIVPLYAFKQICPHLEKERMSFRHTQRNTVKFTLNIIYFLFLLFKLSSGLGSKTVKFDDWAQTSCIPKGFAAFLITDSWSHFIPIKKSVG